MRLRKHHALFGVVPALALLAWALSAAGQQAAPSSAAPAAPAATVKAPPAISTSEALQKAEILDSECWRRAMFELNEWFRSQTIYTPQEVAMQRADFADRVDKMSVDELRAVLADLQVKFQIVNAPEMQEVRAWFGQYLSVLADRKRDEVLRDIPNFATMTPAQLRQEIMKIQRKKQQGRSSQAAFDRQRQSQVDAQLQANRAAQAARQNVADKRTNYRSPYRPEPPGKQFENIVPGGNRSMTLNPNGGLFITF